VIQIGDRREPNLRRSATSRREGKQIDGVDAPAELGRERTEEGRRERLGELAGADVRMKPVGVDVGDNEHVAGEGENRRVVRVRLRQQSQTTIRWRELAPLDGA
jgi:hypothetical protein